MKLHMNEKRVKWGDSESSSVKDYDMRITAETSSNRYTIYSTYDTRPENFKAQVTKLSPYDEQEYIWAQIRNESVAFIDSKTGRVIKRTSLLDIDPDDVDYMDLCNEWADEVLTDTMYTLDDMNSDRRHIRAIY